MGIPRPNSPAGIASALSRLAMTRWEVPRNDTPSRRCEPRCNRGVAISLPSMRLFRRPDLSGLRMTSGTRPRALVGVVVKNIFGRVGACPRRRGGDGLRESAPFLGLNDVHVSYAAVNNTISMPPLLRLMEHRLNQVISDSRQVVQ